MVIGKAMKVDDLHHVDSVLQLSPSVRNSGLSDLLLLHINIANSTEAPLQYLGLITKYEVTRGMAEITVTLKEDLGAVTHLHVYLREGISWKVTYVASLVSAMREYRALKEMRYLHQADLLLKGMEIEHVPISKSHEDLTKRKALMELYKLNSPQAEAVLGISRTQDGMFLIQGPPGTGNYDTYMAYSCVYSK